MVTDTDIRVRPAGDADMAAVHDIYAPYVLGALATFEEVPPGLAEMRARRTVVAAQGLPYLVAEDRAGQVLGYAYANAYRPRPAYRYTVEDSIYVAQGQGGRGIGRALLSAVIAACETGPWRQMVAVIGHSGNAGSIALHASLGFTHAGTMRAVGYKLGQWVDTVMMQRPLGAGSETPPV